MPKITIPANGWRPRKYQMAAWGAFERGIKRTLLVWHRRAGKDELALHQACVAAHLRPANYWHCLPTYEQAKKAIWEAVNPHSGKKRIDEAFPPILRKRTDNSSMTIEFHTGSVWRIVGSDNPDSLVGAPPAGVVFSEWALCNPSAWGLLQPILLENNGWASFITTPRGRNHVRSMLEMARKNPAWFSEVLTVDDTKQVTMEQIESAREEYESLYGREAADALIQQEYYCSFEAAILGAYYGKEMARAEREGRITSVKPWPNVPLHSAWDLGASRSADSMAIWLWQAVPHESGRAQIRVLRYISQAGMSVKYFAQQIEDAHVEMLDTVRREMPDAELPRGTDFVPHDAKVPEMTSSGKDGRAKLRIEVMIESGLKPKIVTNHFVADGISAVRQLFPRFWIDEYGCVDGISALRSYQTEWDDELKKFRDTPRKDWACHGADAFRYLAMAFRELRPEEARPPGRMLTIGGEANLPVGVKGATLNDLWALQPRHQSRRI